MEEEKEGQQPNLPFWANHGGPRRTISSASGSSTSSSSSSSSLLKQRAFVFILLILLVLFFYSFKGRTFRPSLVRTSWDYLNVALLIFAIVCGVLGRNDNGGEDKPVESAPPSSPPRWFGYGETTVKENMVMVMRRNSSSYPDLRQQQWVTDDEWRFADDIEIYRKERKSSGRNRSFRDSEEGKIGRDLDFKTIHVDTFRLKKSPPPPPPPPPPMRRTNVGKARQGKDEWRKEKIESSTPSQPQPQQPSLPPPTTVMKKTPEEKEKRNQRRRKDIAAAISMFYQKNKRNSSKGKRSYDDFLLTSTTPPIPPPPPPPPLVRSNPSVLYNLFHSKKERTKRKQIHSIPPPPPPPEARKITPVRMVRPPIPSGREVGRSKIRETDVSYHNPVIPPPPPPPVEEEMVIPTVAEEGGNRESSLSCPSPDVNSKADMFIARLHEGWRLEKLNSIRKKEKRKHDEEEEEENT